MQAVAEQPIKNCNFFSSSPESSLATNCWPKSLRTLVSRLDELCSCNGSTIPWCFEKLILNEVPVCFSALGLWGMLLILEFIAVFSIFSAGQMCFPLVLVHNTRKSKVLCNNKISFFPK